ncbi:hypothetical protein VTI28DRAFT_6391 [Corynascus sepedonium]
MPLVARQEGSPCRGCHKSHAVSAPWEESHSSQVSILNRKLKWSRLSKIRYVRLRTSVKENLHDLCVLIEYIDMQSGPILAALGVNIRTIVKKQQHSARYTPPCGGLEGGPINASLDIGISTSVKKQSYYLWLPFLYCGLESGFIKASLSVDVGTIVKK